jgi:hypothetical protein
VWSLGLNGDKHKKWTRLWFPRTCPATAARAFGSPVVRIEPVGRPPRRSADTAPAPSPVVRSAQMRQKNLGPRS